MGEKTAFTAELDLKFFATDEFDPMESLSPSDQASAIARNVLRVLMMGWTPSWKELLTPLVAHAVIVERNPAFLKEMRNEFQQGFKTIYKQVIAENLDEVRREQIQLYLSNCLALLPYSDLTPYESIEIPQYIDGLWELVEYQVKPIELTEGHELDSDRVFAYGLEPLFHKKAEPHLIFMGTTYPAGQGFLTQINSDSKGFETVGTSLYQTGRTRIQKWLEQQEHPIHVCGTSLGGSLSLLLAMDKGKYELSRVDALNPAGLHDAHSPFDHWDELPNKPKVVVQAQGDDPVSYFGVWKDDWDIIHVAPPTPKKGPNGFADHALNYAGLKGTQFSFIDAKLENEKRKTRNFWLYSVARSVIYYGILAPYTHVVRPIGHFLVKNWPLLILLPLIVVTAYVAIIGVLTGLALLAVATALIMAAAAVLVYDITRDRITSPYAKMHDPKLPRNKEMDIYDMGNAVDVELSYKEINTYYKMMRQVKEKKFLPIEERDSKHVSGISKRALLETSENPDNENARVPFHVTKAKAAHIRHTLTLIHQIGTENKEHLNQALKDNYNEYRLGKRM